MNFNPLIDDFSTLKDEELSKRIADLNKKVNIALSLGNGWLAQQVQAILYSLQEETSRRQRAEMNKLLQKQNNDIKNLIKVD